MFHKEVYEPCVQYATKYLPHVVVHTDTSVVVWVQLISTLKNGCDESFVPDVREVPETVLIWPIVVCCLCIFAFHLIFYQLHKPFLSVEYEAFRSTIFHNLVV